MVVGDLAPTFSDLYPELLADAGISEERFRRCVEELNGVCVRVFSPKGTRNFVDGVLGLLTGWVWDDIGALAVKSGVREVEAMVERWNFELGQIKAEARWVGLRRSAFMSVSSSYLLCARVVGLDGVLTCDSLIFRFRRQILGRRWRRGLMGRLRRLLPTGMRLNSRVRDSMVAIWEKRRSSWRSNCFIDTHRSFEAGLPAKRSGPALRPVNTHVEAVIRDSQDTV